MNEHNSSTQLDTAMKYDGEKLRTDLIPVAPILEIAKVLTYGAKKYSERNWEKGLKWSRCYGAALRHLFAWFSGETNDTETGINHLAHAACEIIFLLEFTKTHTELDDRPKKPNCLDPLMEQSLMRKTMRDYMDGTGHKCPINYIKEILVPNIRECQTGDACYLCHYKNMTPEEVIAEVGLIGEPKNG